MRKLLLTLAAGAAVLSTGALPSNAGGMPSGAGTAYGPAYEDNYRSGFQPVHWRGHGQRYVCTHFWNGRWHHREICVWVPKHRRYHGHHHFN